MKTLFALAVFILSLGHFQRVLGQAGMIDPTFDPGIGPQLDYSFPSIYAITVQPDGRILVSGTFTNWNNSGRAFLVRLFPDGSVDRSFVATLTTPPNSITMQGEKILVDLPRRLWRLNADGSVDDTFHVVERDGTTQVAPDGSLIRAGTLPFSAYPYFARWSADGVQDTNFNVILGPSRLTRVHDFVIQPDGKIVLDGNFQTPSKFIARLEADGSVDTNFVIAPLMYPPSDLELAPGGALFLSEYDRLYRLLPDGNIDTNFNFTGPGGNTVSSMRAQPAGKVIVAFGTSMEAPHLLRLNTDGSVDSAFFTGFTNSNDYIHAMALQPDGRVIVSGQFTTVQGKARNRIVRLLGDAPVLNVGRSGSNLIFSWPAAYTNAVLQVRPNAAAGTWENLGAGAATSNDLRTLSVPVSNTARYFRLRQP